MQDKKEMEKCKKEIKEYLPIIKRAKLFSKLEQDAVESILHCLSAEIRSYQKGEFIFRIGESISEVALLLEGCIYIQREDYWGNLSILSEISQGELFGETYAVLESDAMVNNVLAVTDCEVLFFPFAALFQLCSFRCCFYTQLIQNLFIVMASKNRILAQKLGHMSQRTTREKLLSYLSEQSVKAGSSSFTIPFNRQQLADFLSVDRSAMSNELSKMKREGKLDFYRSYFTLKES